MEIETKEKKPITSGRESRARTEGGNNRTDKSRSWPGQGHSTLPPGKVTTIFRDFPVIFANWEAD